MEITKHLSESLKLNPAPSPWPRMVLCALSVTLPLILGLITGEREASIYGSLMGFMLVLNDHFGPLKQRILHLFTAFIFLVLAFLIGLSIAEVTWAVYPLLFLMAFIVGKSKGLGLELERLVLFCTLQILNAAMTPGLHLHTSGLLKYASLSFVNYLVCLFLVYRVFKHRPNFQKRKRELLRKAFSQNETKRFSYTVATGACLGLVIAEFFELAKGNWVAATILIVMMPSTSQTYQKSFQRAFGTFIGVMISLLITHYAKEPVILVTFSAFVSFLTPLGLIRNYWLANVFIAGLIMFFMELSSPFANSEVQFAILRVTDIGLGCIIGAIATRIAFPGSKK